MTRAYRIGAAAARSGLSEAVIRAWERRYGVILPARTPGGYRVYGERDIALLRRLRELTEDGMAIGEAAALAPRLRAGIDAERRVADGAQLARWRRAMLAAAARLDQDGIARVLDGALAVLPPLAVYDALVLRIERDMTERAARSTAGRTQQRLLSQVLRGRLLDMLGAVRGRSRGHAVCACLPGEEHDLGLLGAALRFREATFRVTFLGARTPVEHLVHVARRLRARVVALACVRDPGAAALGRTLAAVRRALPRATRCVIGGRAAVQHAALCARAGVTVVEDAADWRRVLDPGHAPRPRPEVSPRRGRRSRRSGPRDRRRGR